MKLILKFIVQFFIKWPAKFYLLLVKPKVIVVAGTTGRHWVKENLFETLLSKNFNVRCNQKNFNAEIGLPLSIMGLSSGKGKFWKWIEILFKAIGRGFLAMLKKNFLPDYLILEMAIDRPNNMDYLIGIVKPQIAVLTTATMVYQENFEGLDQIAEEFKKLVKILPNSGLLILNNDDERIRNLKNFAFCQVLTYGTREGSDFRAKNIRKNLKGQNFVIESKNHSLQKKPVFINRFGQHHIYAKLVSEAVKKFIEKT